MKENKNNTNVNVIEQIIRHKCQYYKINKSINKFQAKIRSKEDQKKVMICKKK